MLIARNKVKKWLCLCVGPTFHQTRWPDISASAVRDRPKWSQFARDVKEDLPKHEIMEGGPAHLRARIALCVMKRTVIGRGNVRLGSLLNVERATGNRH